MATTTDMTRFFRLCLSLTNLNVLRNSLRADDEDVYTRSKGSLYSIGTKTGKKRKRSQRMYRGKRTCRLNAAYFHSEVETDSEALVYDENVDRS